MWVHPVSCLLAVLVTPFPRLLFALLRGVLQVRSAHATCIRMFGPEHTSTLDVRTAFAGSQVPHHRATHCGHTLCDPHLCLTRVLTGRVALRGPARASLVCAAVPHSC